MAKEKPMTLKEAAAYAGVTRRTLNSAITTGKLNAMKVKTLVGSLWVTTQPALDEWLRHRKPRVGRPRKTGA